MTAEAATMLGLLRLTLLAVLSWQAAAHSGHSRRMLPTCEELSTSLIISQLAVLKMMHDSSNPSCAAVEMEREEAQRLEEALGAQVDRVQATLEARQRQHMQQMFDAFNRTAEDILTKLREEMKEELANAVLEAQITPTTPAVEQPTTKATEQPTTEPTERPTTEATKHTTTVATEQLTAEARKQPTMETVTELADGTTVSLCNGNKTLHGTVGALEVVSSGSYLSNVRCSWGLSFPTKSSVSLSWDYMDMEPCCQCDWVTVYDVTNSQDVYGRKLCGRSLSSSKLPHLNVNVPGTRNLLVTFRSDGSVGYRGFRMLYRAH